MANLEDIDVAVILINYNSSEYTIKCIESILQQTAIQINYRIIVVDNASELEDYNNIKSISELDRVEVFRSKLNLGFAGGNMFGVQQITAKYYFFLNNDCLLLNDCISILFSFLDANPEVGMCSPQMYSEKNELVGSFDYFPSLFTKVFGTNSLKLIRRGRFYKRKGKYIEPIKVDVISGSQIFIRGSVFREIGGFDTTFFLYCEEEDISFKVKNAKFDTYLVPEAKNMHIGGGSTKRNYYIRREYYISFLYLYRKHYGYIAMELIKFILFIKVIRKSFSNFENLRLAFFILGGANMKNSLKHSQKIKTV
jgi:GT2 family glycosyltransferase